MAKTPQNLKKGPRKIDQIRAEVSAEREAKQAVARKVQTAPASIALYVDDSIIANVHKKKHLGGHNWYKIVYNPRLVLADIFTVLSKTPVKLTQSVQLASESNTLALVLAVDQ